MIVTTRVVTGLCRLGFPHLFTPRQCTIEQDRKPRYETDLILDCSTTLQRLRDAANAAAMDYWHDHPPSDLRSPFRDGDEKRNYSDYHGRTFIHTWTLRKPVILTGPDRRPTTGQFSVKTGCQARASVTAFAYDRSGNQGVSFALNNIWLVDEFVVSSDSQSASR